MIGTLFDALGNQSKDMDAINDYFLRTNPKTTPAAKLRGDWIVWHDGLNAVERRLSADVMKEATNRRNAFNIANAASPQELANVRDVIAKSPSREEMQGQPRKTDTAGNYPTAKGITVASAAKNAVPKGARPTIRQGSVGEPVVAWQTIIGVKPADGKFGPGTKAATMAWQKKHGLTEDGIVGAASWATALGGSQADPMPPDQAAVTPVTPIGQSVKVGEVAQTNALKIPPKKKPAVSKPAPEVAKKAAQPSKVVTPASPNVSPKLQKDVGVQTSKVATFMDKYGSWVAGTAGFVVTKLILRK